MRAIPTMSPRRRRPRASAAALLSALLLPLAGAACSDAGGEPSTAAPPGGPPTVHEPPPVAAPADPATRLDARLAETFGEDEPGVAVVVVHRGERVHVATRGLANLATGAPITEDTEFGLGRITELFTSVVVHDLVRRGVLALDEPVSTRLRELRPAFGDALTVRHLLEHTDGLPDYHAPMDSLFEKIKIRSRFGNEVKRLTMPDNDDALEVLATWGRPVAGPGAALRDERAGYELLATLVGRVTGATWSTYLRGAVLDPLGMESAWTNDVAARVRPARAYDYTPAEDGFTRGEYRRMERVVGSEGVAASPADVARFLAALDAGEGPLDGWWEHASRPTTLADGTTARRSESWLRDGWNGRRLFLLDSPDSAFPAAVARLPDEGWSVAVLSNRTDSRTAVLAKAALACFVDAARDAEGAP